MKRPSARAALLDYDDLIVDSPAPARSAATPPWVLYKLDGGIDHILIDEAQDTSPEQWDIVTRLTEEFFAGEGVDKACALPRTIFAVGDEKQSIFSFQGADPAQFDIHRRYFADRIGGGAFADVRLDDLAALGAGCAALRRRGLRRPGGARRRDVERGTHFAIARIAKTTRAASNSGRCIAAAEGAGARSLARRSIAPSLDKPRRAAGRTDRRHASRTGPTARRGCPGKTEPIRPGDIMVLMPRREPFGSALIRALKMRGIPVAGADRIKLAEQIAVMDLIALGRFALLPEDDLNLAALLRSPLIGFSEDELYALSVGRDGTLWQALIAARADDPHSAEALRLSCRPRSPAPTTRRRSNSIAAVLSTHGLRQALAHAAGRRSRATPIDEFLSLALSYEALNTPSLEGFLHWIERGDAEVKRDMERGRDEVRVMTVHGAKGLEADIVILPDTASQPGGERNRVANILYTEDGPVYPVKNDIAPERVRKAKQRRRQEGARGTSPAPLCGAHPRARPALCLRLSRQERGQSAFLVHAGPARRARKSASRSRNAARL